MECDEGWDIVLGFSWLDHEFTLLEEPLTATAIFPWVHMDFTAGLHAHSFKALLVKGEAGH